MITAEDLALGRHAPVLRELQFRIEPGCIVGIVGRSGAGKSTLLSTLSGEISPLSGTLLVDGRAPRHWKAQERARRIGFLRQDAHVVGAWRASEVVALGRTPYGDGDSPGGRRLCQNAMEVLGVAHLADRPCVTLSGGEQQRVHLARVLVQIHSGERNARGMLLLDEPTSALDLAAQESLLSLLRRIADAGVSVVVTLHDLNVALRHSDAVLVLANGRQEAFGPPDEVLNEPLVKSAFGVDVISMRHPLTGVPVIVPAQPTRPSHGAR